MTIFLKITHIPCWKVNNSYPSEMFRPESSFWAIFLANILVFFCRRIIGAQRWAPPTLAAMAAGNCELWLWYCVVL